MVEAAHNAAPFMTRRARLIVGETQETFAERFGVDAASVSRWERGKMKPNAKAMCEIRCICRKADPCYSEEWFKHTRAIKMLVKSEDLDTVVMFSPRARDTLGFQSDEEFLEWAIDGDLPSSDWQRVKTALFEHKPWADGAISFFECHGRDSLNQFYWHVIGGQLAEIDCTLIEAQEEPDLGPKFWLKVHPFDGEAYFLIEPTDTHLHPEKLSTPKSSVRHKNGKARPSA